MARDGVNKDANYDFVNGSIVKIGLQNFMTFKKFELYPKARMNVILGPNGSGKSSILCGICLGLGGKPSNVGRSSALSDYIRHGCEKAGIEIELFSPADGNFVIKREIQRNNKSRWSINAKESTQKEVDQLTARLNIQMNNLCQFLPQDKVVEFVRMTKEELLENTQKAANVDDLWENHCKLKNWNEKSKDLEVNYRRIVEEFDKEKQTLSYFEAQVHLYNERSGCVDKINTYRKKRAWLVYEKERDECSEMGKEIKSKEQELTKFNATLNPARALLNDTNAQVQTADAKLKIMTSAIKEQNKKVDFKLEAIENIKDELFAAKEKFRRKEGEERERFERLKVFEAQLKNFQHEYDSIEYKEEEIEREFKAVAQELAACITESNRISTDKDGIIQQRKELERQANEVKTELRRHGDVHRAKMQVLNQKDRDAHTIANWLKNNPDKFKGKVHGPIMLELNVHKPANAKYVERSISFNDMIAFVCENENDIETLMNVAKHELRVKVNTVMAPSTPSHSFQPPVPIENIRQYGFQNYLREMVSTPEPVMRYLCQQYRFHQIPVGNDEVRSKVDEIMARTNIRFFYATNHQYSISQSKYGKRNMSYRYSELSPPNILTYNVDTEKIKDLENRNKDLMGRIESINNDIAELQNNERSINQKMDQLRSQKKEMLVKKNKRKDLHLKIAEKENSIKRVITSKIDLVEEKVKRNNRLAQLVDEKLVSIGQHANLCKAMITMVVDRVAVTCDHRLLIQECKKIEKDIRERSKEIEDLKKSIDTFRSNYKRRVQYAQSLLKDAKRLCNMTTTANEIPKELQEVFASNLNSIDEIDQEIHQLQAKIDCMQEVNAGTLADYEESQEKMKRLEKQKEEYENKMSTFGTNMADAKNKWLQPLQALLANINKRFSYYFTSLGCSGEVGLSVGENKSDYSKYGISIKVKFRDNDPLRELTQTYQSGGERSVSTVLYLLSLQEFVKLPFCCVDEINQGMDSTNERRVFQLMTQILCSETRSQYFLVTPKLLPDMDFHENVNINFLMSGDYCLSKPINMQTSIENALKD